MSQQLLCVSALGLLILLTISLSEVSSTFVKCKQDADCNSPLASCHAIFKFCVNLKSKVSATATRNPSPCNCLTNEYCHPIFVRCLPILTAPAIRNSRKPTAVKCFNDSDCQTGKYCHQQFKTCLDILAIPTLVTTKSSAISCKNDSNCALQQYCHTIFKICLMKPNISSVNTKTSQSRFACSNDTDCQAGYYCHNITNICFKMRAVTKSIQSRMPSPHKKKNSCRNDSDCRITEFCYHIFGQAKVVARNRRKCRDGLGCFQKRSRRASGACVPKIVSFDPPYLNCRSDKDCGNGKCCLRKLGVCTNILKRGQTCVTKNADFTCACSKKLFCKPNNKGKKLKGRRLERKLKIPKYIRHLLLNKGLLYHKKYTYGRCQHVAN